MKRRKKNLRMIQRQYSLKIMPPNKEEKLKKEEDKWSGTLIVSGKLNRRVIDILMLYRLRKASSRSLKECSVGVEIDESRL